MVRSMLVALASTPAATREAEACLSRDEKARASRFVLERDQRRFVIARAALRRELGTRLGVPAAKVEFRYGSQGKPALESSLDACRVTFSLSHSGDFALLAFADGCEVGVDLERLRELRFGRQVARRVFSDRENRALNWLGGPRWTEEFFRCWTRREALVKCGGDGLFAPPASPIEFGTTRRFATVDVPAPAGYVAAVCVAGPAVALAEAPLYSAG